MSELSQHLHFEWHSSEDSEQKWLVIEFIEGGKGRAYVVFTVQESSRQNGKIVTKKADVNQYDSSEIDNARISEKILRISRGEAIIKLLKHDVFDVFAYFAEKEPWFKQHFPGYYQEWKKIMV